MAIPEPRSAWGKTPKKEKVPINPDDYRAMKEPIVRNSDEEVLQILRELQVPITSDDLKTAMMHDILHDTQNSALKMMIRLGVPVNFDVLYHAAIHVRDIEAVRAIACDRSKCCNQVGPIHPRPKLQGSAIGAEAGVEF